MTCDRSVGFSRYSGFLHQENWPPRYSRNNVESGVKHHKTNQLTYIFLLFTECSKTLNLPNIAMATNHTRCLMTTTCTAVDCCTDVDFIPRSFKTFVHIDPCTQEMVIGIEKFRRNISLSTYNWGNHYIGLKIKFRGMMKRIPS